MTQRVKGGGGMRMARRGEAEQRSRGGLLVHAVLCQERRLARSTHRHRTATGSDGDFLSGSRGLVN